jgi:hypothetical protein
LALSTSFFQNTFCCKARLALFPYEKVILLGTVSPFTTS